MLQPDWKDYFQVLLTTEVAVKTTSPDGWIHHTQLKRDPIHIKDPDDPLLDHSEEIQEEEEDWTVELKDGLKLLFPFNGSPSIKP